MVMVYQLVNQENLGLASTFNVSCPKCGWTLALPTSSRTVGGVIEVNRRAVYGFLQIGQGLTGMQKLCGTERATPHVV